MSTRPMTDGERGHLRQLAEEAALAMEALQELAGPQQGTSFDAITRAQTRWMEAYHQIEGFVRTRIPADWVERARVRIDWAVFAEAQQVGEIEQRYGPYKEVEYEPYNRDELVEQLRARIGEEVVQANAAAALLALRWRAAIAFNEDTRLPDAVFADLLDSEQAWVELSTAPLTTDTLRAILDVPRERLPMEPAIRNGSLATPTVAMIWRGLPMLARPWEGDRSLWPTSEAIWGKKNHPGALTLAIKGPPGSRSAIRRAEAWETAREIDEWVALTAFHLAAMYQANTRHNGRLETTTNALLDQMGPERRHDSREAVNRALYVLSRIEVAYLSYYWDPLRARREQRKGARKVELRTLREGAPDMRLSWLDYDARRLAGENYEYVVRLGDPLLQMARDFPSQVVWHHAGDLALDRRSPYLAILGMMLPILMVAERGPYVEHGVTMERLVRDAALVDPATVDPRKRRDWAERFVRNLSSFSCIEQVRTLDPAPKGRWSWDAWLRQRVVLVPSFPTPPRLDTGNTSEVA